MNSRESQNGIVLPVVLIIMVIMLLLGVTVIRNVTLEEKMAGNSRNSQLAFQAAEEALRFCENYIQASTPSSKFYDAQTPMSVSIGNPYVASPSVDDSKWTDGNYRRVLTDVPNVSQQPSCIIEKLEIVESTALQINDPSLPPPPLPFLVTARGYGASQDTVVMLQSYLRVPTPKPAVPVASP